MARKSTGKKNVKNAGGTARGTKRSGKKAEQTPKPQQNVRRGTFGF